MVARTLTCRGALTVHKDQSVMCSNGTCSTSQTPESALATHSCIVVCHDPRCVVCTELPNTER
jgi:hypothetical protein